MFFCCVFYFSPPHVTLYWINELDYNVYINGGRYGAVTFVEFSRTDQQSNACAHFVYDDAAYKAVAAMNGAASVLSPNAHIRMFNPKTDLSMSTLMGFDKLRKLVTTSHVDAAIIATPPNSRRNSKVFNRLEHFIFVTLFQT